ncbi:MAG: YkgJ family cysteine cluster protein, partial [Methanocalculus sp.]|nr:YkgJ family cysteine cluster protein [Methanocalculus sp.]
KNSKGERVGRIMGFRHLATDDPDLRRLFEESSEGLKGQSDHLWDETVIGMLRSAGYIVRI